MNKVGDFLFEGVTAWALNREHGTVQQNTRQDYSIEKMRSHYLTYSFSEPVVPRNHSKDSEGHPVFVVGQAFEALLHASYLQVAFPIIAGRHSRVFQALLQHLVPVEKSLVEQPVFFAVEPSGALRVYTYHSLTSSCTIRQFQIDEITRFRAASIHSRLSSDRQVLSLNNRTHDILHVFICQLSFYRGSIFVNHHLRLDCVPA